MTEFLHKADDNIIRVGIVLVLFLTTLLPVEVRWMECEIWMFNGIPVLLLLGYAMQIWKMQKLNVTLADIIATIWFIYYVGRAWIGNEWSCQMDFLKTAELWMLYMALRMVFNGTKMSVWVLVRVILAFGCYEAWLGISQMYVDETSRHNLYALTGNFLNPGPYSAYLMIGVVVGLAALKEMPNNKVVSVIPKFVPMNVVEIMKHVTWKHLTMASVAFMAMLLPATMSRAAYVGLVFATLFIYRDRYWKYRYVILGGIILLGLVCYFAKQGSADGRAVIWKASLTGWIHYPWLGVGIGGFFHAFSEGMTQLTASGAVQTTAGVPDWAYNTLVGIIVEQGIVGGIFAMTFTTVVLMKLHINSKPLFYGILSLLVFSMFSYPLGLFPYKVIAVLIVAWSESKGVKHVFEIGKIKGFILSCFLAFTSWQAGKIAYESFELTWDFGNSYCNYIYEDFYRLRDYGRDNYVFLFAYAQNLREKGRFNDSNDVLRQGIKCSSDPVFYVLMGNNYKDMKCYDLAEESYYKAFSVMPNRLYPWYMLMHMYLDSGNVKKAKTMARRVIGMKPKIESRLTKDMKEEAKEFLRQH